MLVTLQFPIADARPFGAETDLRLPFPDWPDPDASSFNPQFVHHFGRVIERRREPEVAWPDELKYCLAQRGLRFDRLETRHAGKAGRRFRPVRAFRRLFSDGQAVVRVEIGIAHDRNHPSLSNLRVDEVLMIGRSMMLLPTKVRPLSGETESHPLIRQGRPLASLYAQSSGRHASAASRNSANRRLVEAGDPMLLVELRPGEADLSSGCDGLTQISPDQVNGATACFCRLQTKHGIVSTWILQRGQATQDQLRSLRICLTRLHAEQEVLDRILKQIRRKRLLNPPTEEAANRLDTYFNEHLKIIDRKKWAGLDQSAILAAFDATQNVVRPAARSMLLNQYEGCRRQIWNKIENFQQRRRAVRIVNAFNIENVETIEHIGDIKMEKNINVSGSNNIVNVAEYMSNVTNTVTANLAESNEDAEVNELIQLLTKQIGEIASEVEAEQTKKLGKNLEALSKEVTNDEPDPRWYELSLNGLKEAAETVGQIAAPVLKTVGKLATLLLA